MTSSPGSVIAMSAFSMPMFAPAVTMISRPAGSIPFSRASFSPMAARSSGIPSSG